VFAQNKALSDFSFSVFFIVLFICASVLELCRRVEQPKRRCILGLIGVYP
jgi:hypothetical protein